MLGRTHIRFDFLDATISRTAAWAIGTRNMQKALLRALLMPLSQLRMAEDSLDVTTRLTAKEDIENMPFGAV
ncbi:L-rhamnose isomerase [Yoonia sp. F2084L]|uniref:L-rhamnose isomerase n=1 Tax=Yoonia sp. F2084L TaxID=2926419 RepID=UPI001FF53B21|nr:L-rhamnose isomerase [Yoonia sp. F2084L]MCK0094154.1 L-rhamnose isomerase [Yoonia sp. F2084L]